MLDSTHLGAARIHPRPHFLVAQLTHRAAAYVALAHGALWIEQSQLMEQFNALYKHEAT
jgi:hypothetical protein